MMAFISVQDGYGGRTPGPYGRVPPPPELHLPIPPGHGPGGAPAHQPPHPELDGVPQRWRGEQEVPVQDVSTGNPNVKTTSHALTCTHALTTDNLT